MAVERYTVRNPHKYGVSIHINDGKEMKQIPPNKNGKDGTDRITEEDIRYNESHSCVFSKGYLIVEKAPELKEELEITDPQPITETELTKLFRLSEARFRAALEAEDKDYNLARIIEYAAAHVNEIPQNKIKAIEEATGKNLTPIEFDEG